MDWQLVGSVTLVAGCVLYVARLFAIAFGRLFPDGNGAAPAASMSNILADDPNDDDYYLLWSTQIPALQFLSCAGGGEAPAVRMRSFHREFGRVYPELADGFAFESWLDALQEAGMAVRCRAAATVLITEKGRQLLESMERDSLPERAMSQPLEAQQSKLFLSNTRTETIPR